MQSGIQMSMKKYEKAKEKFADLLLDISKYVITGVLLTAIFVDAKCWEWYELVILFVAVCVVIAFGLWLYKKEDKSKEE